MRSKQTPLRLPRPHSSSSPRFGSQGPRPDHHSAAVLGPHVRIGGALYGARAHLEEAAPATDGAAALDLVQPHADALRRGRLEREKEDGEGEDAQPEDARKGEHERRGEAGGPERHGVPQGVESQGARTLYRDGSEAEEGREDEGAGGQDGPEDEGAPE